MDCSYHGNVDVERRKYEGPLSHASLLWLRGCDILFKTFQQILKLEDEPEAGHTSSVVYRHTG